MNYLKVYCNLIRKAENRTPPEGYTEKHHTFPVSIFGKNKRIVVLTAREHYIAHALLEKICLERYGLEHWKTKKMIYAHIMMKVTSKCNQKRYYNSYLYECSKIRMSKNIIGENHPLYRRTIPEERKMKISNSLKGHFVSEETRKKIGNAHKGKVLTEEQKSRWNSFKGKNHSEETKKLIGSYHKGKILSEETRKKISKSKKGQVPSNKGKSGPTPPNKGKICWNNGQIHTYSLECPGDGWVRGRIANR
jgi:hypothetical protein